MIIVPKCRSCKSRNLEIRDGGRSHHAALYCSDCDRFVRWLTQYQATAFGRHLPQQQPAPEQQLSLLEGGDA